VCSLARKRCASNARLDAVSRAGPFLRPSRASLAAVATMGCAASTSNAAPSGDKPPGKVDRKGLCKKVFQAMDSDGDGYVDINEFMTTQKGGDDPMEATMLFHMLDSQKKSDGKLELDEFIKGMALLGSDDATFKKEMEDVLAHLAAKKNAPPPAKSISGGEVTSAPEHERAIAIAAAPIVETPVSAIDPRVTEVFNLIDKNQDGRLSKAELLIALRKNESVRAALGMDNVSDGEGKEKFEAAFQKMDTDGSASISMSELNSYLAGALP
jgi:Ca2+-binding EF-hand superfamily protein